MGNNIIIHITTSLLSVIMDNFCLKWQQFESHLRNCFQDLRSESELCDVTLVCEERQVEAHKVVLSASSSFFKKILKNFSHPHPLVFLKGVKFSEIQSILNFIYQGEVNVAQDDLNSFLSVAEELKIKGLSRQNFIPSTSSSTEPNHTNLFKHQPTESQEFPPLKRARSGLTVGNKHHEHQQQKPEMVILKTESMTGLQSREDEDIIIPPSSSLVNREDITEQDEDTAGQGLEDIWSKLEKSGKIIRCRICGLNKHQDFFATLVNHIRKDHL